MLSRFLTFIGIRNTGGETTSVRDGSPIKRAGINAKRLVVLLHMENYENSYM